MPSAIPTPPPDASGGYLIFQLTNGVDTHRLRLHVAPFNYGTGTNFAYSSTIGSGTEAGISDTAANFMAQVKTFYDSAWTMSLYSVFQIVGGVPVERFGWPIPAAVAGTATQSAATAQSRVLMANFNLKSANGGRARVSLIGTARYAGSAGLGTPYRVTSANDSAGNNLQAYLAGANCAARCHDGQPFSPQNAWLTFVTNKRLRRREGWA